MSLQIFVDGFDGRPLPTGATVTGHVRLNLKRPDQASSVNHVLLAFNGSSSVQIVRRTAVTRMQYSSHHRYELQGIGSNQPRPVGNRTEWTTSVYESQCLLFTHQHLLSQSSFQSPAAGQDAALVFPFEFRIPTHSEPQPPDVVAAHNSDCFSASGCFPGALGYYPPNKTPDPQPLPDTVNSFEDYFNEVDETANGTASVRYTLHAVAPQLPGGGRWRIGSSSPAESSVNIPLFNPVSLSPRPIQYKTLGHQDTIRSLRLLQTHQESKLSFRENMRSIFKKDRLPWFALGITFSAPELLWVDQPPETKLPFVISLRRLAGGVGDVTGPPPMPLPGVPLDEKGRPLDPAAAAAVDNYANNNPDHVPTPQVFLKSLELKLVAHTAIRGGHDRFSGYGPKRFEGLTAVPFFKFKASRSTAQLEVPVGDSSRFDLGVALDATLGHLRPAGAESGIGGITGEFLTPNVWRRWGVEWDIKLECAGEELRWCSESSYGGGLGLRFLRGDGTALGPPPPPQPPPPPSQPIASPHSEPAPAYSDAVSQGKPFNSEN